MHDSEARTLELKRGPVLDDVPLPAALIPGDVYSTKAQEAALERFGRSLLDGGGAYPVLESILRRDAFGRDVQTTDLDEMAELLLAIGRGDPALAPPGGPVPRHLVIQGPPGSGKTWTAGRLIARLVAEGKSVGVASTSHRAIHKLLAEVETAATERGLPFEGVKKASRGNPESEFAGQVVENVFDNADCVDRRRRRRDGLAVRGRPPREALRLPLRRRGRPGLAGGCVRDGDLRPNRSARRRPAAARPGAPGLASRRERGVGAPPPDG